MSRMLLCHRESVDSGWQTAVVPRRFGCQERPSAYHEPGCTVKGLILTGYELHIETLLDG